MKITAREWLAFANDDEFWGQQYIDDEYVIVADEEIDIDRIKGMAANTKITIEGSVYNSTGNYVRSLDAQIKLWRKKQTTTTFVVEVKKENLEALKSAIVSAGGKIIP
jgi:selenophosphate synthetase-related protein